MQAVSSKEFLCGVSTIPVVGNKDTNGLQSKAIDSIHARAESNRPEVVRLAKWDLGLANEGGRSRVPSLGHLSRHMSKNVMAAIAASEEAASSIQLTRNPALSVSHPNFNNVQSDEEFTQHLISAYPQRGKTSCVGCLSIVKSPFMYRNGQDPSMLTVEQNDVVFCLSEDANGWRKVQRVLVDHDTGLLSAPTDERTLQELSIGGEPNIGFVPFPILQPAQSLEDTVKFLARQADLNRKLKAGALAVKATAAIVPFLVSED